MKPCLEEKWEAATRREEYRIREADWLTGRTDDRPQDQVVTERALLSTFNEVLAGLKVQMTHVGEDQDGEPVVEVLLRSSKTPEVSEVGDDYNCGGIQAHVWTTEQGRFRAAVHFRGQYLARLTVAEVRNLKTLCEALIRRSGQK